MDDEDIALSAIKSLCLGLQRGRFPEVNSRDSLWRLLLVITSRKIADQISFEHREKRDVNRVMDMTSPDMEDADSLLSTLAAREPSPAVAAEMADQLSRLLQLLVRDDLQQVALLKMDGFTNREIADRFDCSLATIERRLRTIRAIWSRAG